MKCTTHPQECKMESLHAMNEDDPDRRVQYCEWFQHKVQEDGEFVGKIV
jgi:hypothetical protein